MSPIPILMVAVLLAAPTGAVLAQVPDTPVSASPATPADGPPVVAAPVDTPAATPPPDVAVQVQTLSAPDAFTVAGRDTGLPPDLWRGASSRTVGAVLPLLVARPLSPAAAALARRVLATGARGPDDLGQAPGLLGRRAGALLTQGDPKAAATILGHATGVDRDPDLARAAAEIALLSGDDARACAVEQALGVGRGDIYWLRLRTYCQAFAGQTAQAQFTFDLAQAQAKDAVYGRLMSARLAGTAPGAASLRNGLDYALSRSLGLDLSTAKPADSVAAALGGADPAPPVFDLSADAAIGGLGALVTGGRPLPPGAVGALIAAAAEADPKTSAGARLQGAALLIASLVPDLGPDDRARIAALPIPEGRTPVGRALALMDAGQRRQPGEAALLSLWAAAEAGPAGVGLADRARIVQALSRSGLDAEARAFAAEGIAGLK